MKVGIFQALGLELLGVKKSILRCKIAFGLVHMADIVDPFGVTAHWSLIMNSYVVPAEHAGKGRCAAIKPLDGTDTWERWHSLGLLISGGRPLIT